MSLLYHLLPVAIWQDCKAQSRPYYPATYEQDGFIHLTKDPNVLLSIANYFYKDEPGEYIVLEIDGDKLSSKVAFEPAAPVGSKPAPGAEQDSSEPVLFPHLYGTIDWEAVVGELQVDRDPASGTFLRIHGAAFGSSS